MAIISDNSRQEQGGEESLTIAFSNGDLKTLKAIKEKWSFKDEESLLKFALAILTKGDSKNLYLSVNGEKVNITPAEALLNKPSQDAQEN